jgi:hypothetical protein
MKTSKLLAVLLLSALAILLLTRPALAQSSNSCSREVIGGACRLRSGETLDRLSVLGGAVTLEEGSVVRGDVALVGGALEVSGEVKGSIHAMGGTLNLTDTARVGGGVTTFGASLRQSEKARVEGKVTQQSPGGISLPFVLPELPGLAVTPQAQVVVPPASALDFAGRFDVLDGAVKFFWWVFRTLAVSALALLLALFMPAQVRRVGQTAAAQPGTTGGMGCLTILVTLPVSFLLIVTLILSPIGLLALLMLMAAALFGWMGLGLEVGQRLARMAHGNWAEPVSAAVGTLVLTLVAGAVEWIPCIGWVIPAALVILAVGAVAISRFGARGPGNPSTGQPPAFPPAPPSSAPPQLPAADLPLKEPGVLPPPDAVVPKAVEASKE